MQNSSAEQVSQQKTTTTRRYWKRLEEPSGGWWPWGWLPLLGLLLTFLYGMFVTAENMEEATQARVSSALTSSGHADFNVVADGQHVKIDGVGPETLRPQLESIARGAVCDTWIAKNLICPTRVAVNLTQPKAAAAPVKAAPVKAAPAKAAPKPVVAARFHDFTITKEDESLLLQGEVATTEVRASLVGMAQKLSNNVTDQLRVTNDTATENYPWASEQMFRLLPQLKNGGFAWKQGKLSGWGLVDADVERSVRAGFNQSDKRSLLGDLKLQVIPTADTCNQKFASALTDATIKFQTSSAVISASSQPLLQRLAKMAQECPQNLNVEGHTDSRGSEEMNLALSRARAESVVNALSNLGVDASRLNPIGYGPSRPVADNGTVAGRAQNRRIEIKVAGN